MSQTIEKTNIAPEAESEKEYTPRKQTFYMKHFKRWLDCFLAIMLFIAISPFLLILALVVRLNLGSPILFKQERIGKDEKPFVLYKFRTMTNKKDENGNLLPDKERMTKFGKFLRKTSFDELPELFNIIKGDMCVIGPRPLITRYLPYYTEKERHRHDVYPGLTGYSQVSGRNFLSWAKRFEMDLYYIERCNFFFDVKILVKTVIKVFSKKGIIDYSKLEKNENGEYFFRENGKIYRVNTPLDIERSEMNAVGNRK